MQAALLAAKLYNVDAQQSMMPRMRLDASMLQAAAAKTKVFIFLVICIHIKIMTISFNLIVVLFF
jgi:hypothetical protein